jgi:hypothetical protein
VCMLWKVCVVGTLGTTALSVVLHMQEVRRCTLCVLDGKYDEGHAELGFSKFTLWQFSRYNSLTVAR